MREPQTQEYHFNEFDNNNSAGSIIRLLPCDLDETLGKDVSKFSQGLTTNDMVCTGNGGLGSFA
jgi:hypothetical protein